MEKEKHYEFVDLGLSVQWATCNVGASSPEEYGEYLTFFDAREQKIDEELLSEFEDDLDELDDLYLYEVVFGDYKKEGERVPSENEFCELLDGCNYEWIEQNGIYGGLFTSKKNGNSIFLPAAGYHNGLDVENVCSDGYYWSSSGFGSVEAGFLSFDGGSARMDCFDPDDCLSVRLVRDL